MPNCPPTTALSPTTTIAPASLPCSSSRFRVLPPSSPGLVTTTAVPASTSSPSSSLLPTGDLDVDAVVREHAGHGLAAVVGGVPRVERVFEGRAVAVEDGDDDEGRQDPESDQESRTPRRPVGAAAAPCVHHRHRGTTIAGPRAPDPSGLRDRELRLERDDLAGTRLVRCAFAVPRLVEDRRHRLEATSVSGEQLGRAPADLVDGHARLLGHQVALDQTGCERADRLDHRFTPLLLPQRGVRAATMLLRRLRRVREDSRPRTRPAWGWRAGARAPRRPRPPAGRAGTSAASWLRPPLVAVASLAESTSSLNQRATRSRNGSWYSGRASSSCSSSRADSGSGKNDLGTPVGSVVWSQVTAVPRAATG